MEAGIKIEFIHDFHGFVNGLRQAGMSLGGANGEGIFTLADYFGENIQWHTGDVHTDPWEWRMRVLGECDDIAYGKFFFKKSGYITKEWYPYFYAVRRGDKDLEEAYEDGTISTYARKIYHVIQDNGSVPLHHLKKYCEVAKEDKSKFEAALTELQMKLYLTMCGRERKQSKAGDEYGWSSTVFCMVENFFDQEVFNIAGKFSYEEAYVRIKQQILLLNPMAEEKKIKKFILG